MARYPNCVGIHVKRAFYQRTLDRFGHPLRVIIYPEQGTRYLVYTTDRVSPEDAIRWAEEIATENDFVDVWSSSYRHLYRDRLFSHRGVK